MLGLLGLGMSGVWFARGGRWQGGLGWYGRRVEGSCMYWTQTVQLYNDYGLQVQQVQRAAHSCISSIRHPSTDAPYWLMFSKQPPCAPRRQCPSAVEPSSRCPVPGLPGRSSPHPLTSTLLPSPARPAVQPCLRRTTLCPATSPPPPPPGRTRCWARCRPRRPCRWTCCSGCGSRTRAVRRWR